MELRREEIENKANNTIYKNYSLLFKKLYKDYEYLEIEHHSFNAIVLDEIEKSKATYKEKEIYSVYIKDRINERMILYDRLFQYFICFDRRCGEPCKC